METHIAQHQIPASGVKWGLLSTQIVIGMMAIVAGLGIRKAARPVNGFPIAVIQRS